MYMDALRSHTPQISTGCVLSVYATNLAKEAAFICEVSGFCPGYLTWTARPLNMGPSGVSETSVTKAA